MNRFPTVILLLLVSCSLGYCEWRPLEPLTRVSGFQYGSLNENGRFAFPESRTSGQYPLGGYYFAAYDLGSQQRLFDRFFTNTEPNLEYDYSFCMVDDDNSVRWMNDWGFRHYAPDGRLIGDLTTGGVYGTPVVDDSGYYYFARPSSQTATIHKVQSDLSTVHVFNCGVDADRILTTPDQNGGCFAYIKRLVLPYYDEVLYHFQANGDSIGPIFFRSGAPSNVVIHKIAYSRATHQLFLFEINQSLRHICYIFSDSLTILANPTLYTDPTPTMPPGIAVSQDTVWMMRYFNGSQVLLSAYPDANGWVSMDTLTTTEFPNPTFNSDPFLRIYKNRNYFLLQKGNQLTMRVP